MNRMHGKVLPLQAATLTGHTPTIAALLQLGAEVNAPDGYGRFPLHYAAEKSSDAVKLLLRHGAEVETLYRGSQWEARSSPPWLQDPLVSEPIPRLGEQKEEDDCLTDPGPNMPTLHTSDAREKYLGIRNSGLC